MNGDFLSWSRGNRMRPPKCPSVVFALGKVFLPLFSPKIPSFPIPSSLNGNCLHLALWRLWPTFSNSPIPFSFANWFCSPAMRMANSGKASQLPWPCSSVLRSDRSFLFQTKIKHFCQTLRELLLFHHVPHWHKNPNSPDQCHLRKDSTLVQWGKEGTDCGRDCQFDGDRRGEVLIKWKTLKINPS